MPKVRWVMSYGFVANFICFPAVQKVWKSVKIWLSYREFKGGNVFETQCTSGFGFRDFAYLGRSKSTCIPNFEDISQSNPRLRYNYFRFLRTNVRHFRILLPVPVFTFALPWAYHFLSVYQISSKSYHPRQSYDVIFIFQHGGRQPYWIISRSL